MNKSMICSYIKAYLTMEDCSAQWNDLTYHEARVATRWLRRYRHNNQ